MTFFLRLQTQWEVATGPVWMGLKYPAVESLFRMYGVADQAQLISDIQAMEMAALQVLNKRGAQDGV